MPELIDAAKLVEQSPLSLLQTYVLPWLDNIFLALLVFVIGRWISRLLVKLSRKLMEKVRVDPLLLNFVASLLSWLLTLFVIIAALDQLGVDTTSLIALIGAAGIAVGLALKDTLQNFASGVLLILFKPFKVGDYIEAGGVAGVVEEIRIFSSLLRSPDNKELIVPNGKIYSDTIVNYSARETRRVDLMVGIAYDADIRLAKQTLQEILDADPRVLAEPAAVIAVSELAESSVNLIIRPWVKSADYAAFYGDTLEKIKLSFDERGISIPFPNLQLHLRDIPNLERL
ncbi:MAG: mechanosensitive ion channel, partial [Gammaproteobacteria bacterium]|nr:mechanosensitive ion channel [Gammaproteobacteria bacterium]